MHLRFEQIVPVPRERLFAFHEDPRNLAVLFRASRSFRLLAHTGHIRAGAVTRVEYALHPLVPVAMAFEHFLYEPPLRFGERMLHGPFAEFVHVHAFDDLGEATRLRDELDVRLPAWLGGEAAMRLSAAGQLRAVFDLRHAELLKLAAEGALGEPARSAAVGA